MERLTKYEVVGGHAHAVPTGDVDQAMMRLAAYEDTRLTPDQIEPMYMEVKELASYLCTNGEDRAIELAKADMEGRVVILPCKIGDVMYKLFREYTECTLYQDRKDNCCCEGCEFPCDSREVTVIRAIQPNSLPEVARYVDEIGKTVFLTREEAEKALEEK